ncbi:MAG: hypothetical protein ACT4PM_06165 [Gemmatimonadales bacterium]
MRRVLPVGFLAALALGVPDASAQSVPNLSGTWVFHRELSDLGGMEALTPQSRTDVWDHQEPKLTIKRTTTSATGESTTTTLVYAIDGEPHKNMAGPTEVTSRLRWEGAALVSVSTIQDPQGEVTITDRYSRSEDGKTLTQERTFARMGQEGRQKLVLVKH